MRVKELKALLEDLDPEMLVYSYVEVGEDMDRCYGVRIETKKTNPEDEWVRGDSLYCKAEHAFFFDNEKIKEGESICVVGARSK